VIHVLQVTWVYYSSKILKDQLNKGYELLLAAALGEEFLTAVGTVADNLRILANIGLTV